MPLKTEQRTKFSDELRVIPTWAGVLAGIGFITMHILFYTVFARDPKAPPWWGLILMAMAAGSVLACYLLMIGYINSDAGRRGMNRLVWTAIAVLMPNALGIVLYFLLRQPLPAICTHCGGKVQNAYCYCPDCGENLAPQCPHCQHAIHAGDLFCPYCGREVKSGHSAPGQGQTELKPQT
jgi:hypothetical protein